MDELAESLSVVIFAVFANIFIIPFCVWGVFPIFTGVVTVVALVVSVGVYVNEMVAKK